MNTPTHSYKVIVNDNFHYMDTGERYRLGEFDSCAAAVTACKNLVEDDLLLNYKPGMAAEQLYALYTSFGDDPFIVTTDEQCSFSAWDYARQRCEVLCQARQDTRKEMQ